MVTEGRRQAVTEGRRWAVTGVTEDIRRVVMGGDRGQKAGGDR